MITGKSIFILMTAIVVLCLSAFVLSQNHENSRIGNDYAKAALRAIIYTSETGVSSRHISELLDEADVEASTPAEEASLKEINRILGNWLRIPSMDYRNCYLALKSNLKARNGATPEACK
jgi:hypothetical protein